MVMMMMSLLLLLFATTAIVNAEPSHMRLALGLTPSHMNVAWDTYDNTSDCSENALVTYVLSLTLNLTLNL